MSVNPLNLKGLKVFEAYDSSKYKMYYFHFNAKLLKDMKSKYTIDGKNFVICVLSKNQNNEWKITELLNAPVDLLVNKGVDFGTTEEKKIKSNISEKQNLIKKALEESKSLNNDSTQMNVLGASAVATTATQPSTIRVKLTQSTNLSYYGKTSGEVVTIGFDSYYKDVLACEWDSDKVVSDSTNSSTYLWPSLYSGAIMVKTYGWFMAVRGWHRSEGFDVWDNTNDQVYIVNKRLGQSQDANGRYFAWGQTCVDAANNASVYHQVIWDSSVDNVAEAHYYQSTQDTTYSMAKSGYTYLQILASIYAPPFYVINY